MTSQVVLLALVLGAVGGAAMPFQTAINTGLAGRLGAILPASLISFAVGSAGLGLLVLATGTQVPLAVAATQPWWIWIGGVCGLVFRTTNIVLMPRFGASATVVLPLVGQVLGGLVIDVTGAFDTGIRSLTPTRVLGAVLVVVGAALVSRSGRKVIAVDAPALARRPHPVLSVAAVLVGSLGAIQTAVNGQLGQAMGSPLAAALVSFLVATAGLVVITLIVHPRLQRTGPFPPWIFSGGLLGAFFVLANAFNAPILGTSLAVNVVMLGQIAAGLVLDHRGWLGVIRRPITWQRLAAAALVLLGVALVQVVV